MEHDHNYAKIPDGENNEIPSEEEDLRGSTSHSDLTPDQITFVVSNRLPYKDLRRLWSKIFNRAPPSRKTVDRHRERFRVTGSIKNCRTGKKPSVRTPEMIAEVKRVLEEESDARRRRRRKRRWR